MEPADVIAVLDRLAHRGIGTWVDGGWCVDALLGAQTRPHADLDLVVARDDVPAACSALGALGYAHDAARACPRGSCSSRRAHARSTCTRSCSMRAAKPLPGGAWAVIPWRDWRARASSPVDASAA